MIRPFLTELEARATLAALSETLDATDEEEQRVIFGGGKQIAAAYRAARKIRGDLDYDEFGWREVASDPDDS